MNRQCNYVMFSDTRMMMVTNVPMPSAPAVPPGMNNLNLTFGVGDEILSQEHAHSPPKPMSFTDCGRH